MKTVRPGYVFEKLADGNRLVTAAIPSPHARSIRIMETYLLIAAARMIEAKTIFEFGTLYGETTLHLARNTPAKIYTFDLDSTSAQAVQHRAGTLDLDLIEAHQQITPQFVGTEFEPRITRIAGDSHTFDFSAFHGSIDMVFIDGGHEYETVKRDTENALAMTRGRRACIAWHDYHSNYPGVVKYLDERTDLPLFHVEESMLVMML